MQYLNEQRFMFLEHMCIVHDVNSILQAKCVRFWDIHQIKLKFKIYDKIIKISIIFYH